MLVGTGGRRYGSERTAGTRPFHPPEESHAADPRTSPRSRPSLRARARRGCPARRRSGVRGAVLALPPADLRVHPEPGPRPRSRRGHRPRRVHVGAAPVAHHRSGDRPAAVAVHDRQERLHRRVSPRRAGTGRAGRLRRRFRRRARLDALAGTDARRRDRVKAAPQRPARRLRRPVGHAPPAAGDAGIRGAVVRRDRRPARDEPADGRERSVPRPPQARLRVRRAGHRPPLRADRRRDRGRHVRDRQGSRCSRSADVRSVTSPTVRAAVTTR